MHFQAYLMEGLCRWNAARSAAAISARPSNLRTFDVEAQMKLHELSVELLGRPVDPHFCPPSKYTGELFGIEYLYAETGICPDDDDIDRLVENGIESASVTHPFLPGVSLDDEFVDPEAPFITLLDDGFMPKKKKQSALPTTVVVDGFETVISETQEVDISCEDHELNLEKGSEVTHPPFAVDNEVPQPEEIDEYLDEKGIPGWDKVTNLASALVESSSLAISEGEARRIIHLYSQLSDFDKRSRLDFQRPAPTRHLGRFGTGKADDSGAGRVTQEVMRMCFITAGSPPQPVNLSRIVVAVCELLFIKITKALRAPKYEGRIDLILEHYNIIRVRISRCPSIVENTKLCLYTINKTSITNW